MHLHEIEDDVGGDLLMFVVIIVISVVVCWFCAIAFNEKQKEKKHRMKMRRSYTCLYVLYLYHCVLYVVLYYMRVTMMMIKWKEEKLEKTEQGEEGFILSLLAVIFCS